MRKACEKKGCWMELAADAKGPGVRVTFKDYGFFVPLDSAGRTAKVEGVVKVAELSESRRSTTRPRARSVPARQGRQAPRGAAGGHGRRAAQSLGMARSFSMRGVMAAADRAVQLARTWLLESEPGSRVHDVQEDPRFQHRGVDLLWERPRERCAASR